MAINFKRLVLAELESQFIKLRDAINTKECPDQYVGKIDEICYQINEFNPRNNGRKEFNRINVDEYILNHPKRSGNVILILESPHIAEFQDRNHQGPAQGPTGTNIRIYLREILDNLGIDYQGRGLILMNAIRYQCSLGLPTDCVRDEIFLKVWNNGGENDFMQRLENLYQKGDVLINCCTTGKGKRGLVTRAINNSGINSLITGSHPSFWSVNRNRRKDKFQKLTPLKKPGHT